MRLRAAPALLGALLLLAALPAADGNTVTPDSMGRAIALAMEAQPNLVVDATFIDRPAASVQPTFLLGFPAGTKSAPAGPFFPTHGATFGVLTTGKASALDDPVQANFHSSLAAGAAHGAFDVLTLAIVVDVPAGHNTLAFDLQFLTEEYPDYLGSPFNDAVIAQLDVPVWAAPHGVTTYVLGPGVVVAPGNFATDANLNPISLNQGTIDPANAVGTGYNAGTCRVTAYTAATPGRHVLYISIFDHTDPWYDSAVLLDNLRTFHAPSTPATDCNPPPPTLSVDAGTPCLDTTITVTSPPYSPSSTYAWDWGDGATGAGHPGIHKYASEGQYTVRLTMHDAYSSMQLTGSTVVDIGPCVLVADVADAQGHVHAPVPLLGTATGGTGQHQCSWEFEGPWSSPQPVQGDCTPEVAWALDGAYQVRLTVHDAGLGASATDEATVHILPLPPARSNEEPSPEGTPGDGEGDEAGEDPDGDGVPASDDRCPDVPDSGLDQDGDGLDDACDGDRDGDGLPDRVDPCPDLVDDGQDLDGDGLGDACDSDDDNDGLPDTDDPCPRSGATLACLRAAAQGGVLPAGGRERPEPPALPPLAARLTQPPLLYVTLSVLSVSLVAAVLAARMRRN